VQQWQPAGVAPGGRFTASAGIDTQLACENLAVEMALLGPFFLVSTKIWQEKPPFLQSVFFVSHITL
jgi:hypothetical protein